MSILVNQETKVICQGITGRAGLFHSQQCREYGTPMVGGVTPGKGGTEIDGFAVYDSVAEAIEATGANTSMVFVPPRFCAGAIVEAAEAGIELIIAITEGVPVLDMVRVRKQIDAMDDCRLVGPNCPGVITPGVAKIGIMPGYIHSAGSVGLVSRSGTLTYEAAWQLGNVGLGQSTCVGIGGDPVQGTDFIDTLKLFNEDDGTRGIALIGEIGGTMEEESAAFIKDNVTKPVAAFIAGATAPPGKRMGHAGAIISGGSGTAADKIAALRAAGVEVAESPADMGEALKRAIERAGG
jgi:succinyl-CoA synthetase alpha subunit